MTVRPSFELILKVVYYIHVGKKAKKRIRALIIILSFSILLTMFGYAMYILGDIPSVYSLKNLKNKPISVVYGKDGQIVYLILPDRRIYVDYSRIPKHVKDAFLAAEDADFFKHKGIEPESLFRALLKNLIYGRVVQGGSTITQQVIKSLILGPEKSLSRKIREVILAYRLENYLSKKEILNLYLNNVYMGHGVYGVEAASQIYFGKHVWEISKAEAAILAGIVQAPSRLSPKKHPGLARMRQEYVIDQMWRKGMINEKEKNEMLKQRVSVREDDGLLGDSYFKDYIIKYVEEKYGKGIFSRKALKIYATIDPDLQLVAERALKEGIENYSRRRGEFQIISRLDRKEWERFTSIVDLDLKAAGLKKGRAYNVLVRGRLKGGYSVLIGKETGFLKTESEKLKIGDVIKAIYVGSDKNRTHIFLPKKESNVQGALICMDPKTGYVYAMVGGDDFEKTPFNRAIYSKIQSGSAFKPFVYLTALRKGYDVEDVIPDEPKTYPAGYGKVWTPRNYDGKYEGAITLKDAIAYSKNAATVRLLEEVGLDALRDTLSQIGLPSDIPNELSVALGTSNLTLFDLVRGFAVFANGGFRVKPVFIKKIEDEEGKILEEVEIVREKVLDEEVVRKMNILLRAVVEYGTAKAASSLGYSLFGKTGTTSNYCDALFVGYSKSLVTGVWIGYDKKVSLGEGESGAKVCLPVWMRFMGYSLTKYPPGDLIIEDEVETHTVF